MNKGGVLVLLSTFNGERYIAAQLESILEQRIEGGLRVLVRDDGSLDGTANIVRNINDDRIELLEGKNVGVKSSYSLLISAAQQRECDYVALADQDDVWKPGKIRRAVTYLEAEKGPALYCSALDLVDVRLAPIGKYYFKDEICFKSAFLSNCATGCTCVFNRKLLGLLESPPNWTQVLMHDWWLYLVAVTFGKVIYDQESSILYRQHQANQVGIRVGVAGAVHRLRMFMRRPKAPSRLTQAQEFRRLYWSSMTTAQSAYVDVLVDSARSFPGRLSFAVGRRPRRKSIVDEMALIATILYGRL